MRRSMLTKDGQNTTSLSPGTWSTDDYIRRWASGKGMSRGACVVKLQSLHDNWIARIDFDRAGHPVERIVELCS
jgi:hypothetical protein